MMPLFVVVPLAVVFATIAVAVLIFKLYRIVVPTNEVHTVQSKKKTVSYGKDETAGNVYYKWPSWLPWIGIKTISLPVSVFDVDLDGYAAYDTGRVPFVIDVMAFFRITDPNMAAQRVHSFPHLLEQLKGILQGACRSILAKSEIEEILEGRGTFGEKFTQEVDHNLQSWGVQTVKCIELMDIRDAQGSKVIENIMAKKKSLIEMQSRVEVAENTRRAETAEIEAEQSVSIRKQEALQQVGIRTAEKDREVGISNEQAQQSIKDQQRVTAEKDMSVKQVQLVRAAEIQRDVQVVAAEQEKRTAIIKAEGEKQQTITVAEGNLTQSQLNAQGIEAVGKAQGEAERARLQAPVDTQISLAKEIGGNEGYQKYLVAVREIEKNQTVGIEQAKALQDAQIKVIANAGNVVSGVDSVMDLLTSKGGTQVGAFVEAFKQTPAGEVIVNNLLKSDQQNGAGKAGGKPVKL